jgi:hypothetical protein
MLRKSKQMQLLTQQKRRNKPPFETSVGENTRKSGCEGLHCDDAADNALVVAE